MTLVELCRAQAARRGEQRQFTFLDDTGSPAQTLTCAQLDLRARAIGAVLAGRAAPGSRAVLGYPPGLDFVTAFFGCLYAGLVPVPAPAPVRTRGDARHLRLRAIFEDCAPDFLLSTVDALARADALLTDTAPEHRPKPLATNEIPDSAATGWQPPAITGDSIAYLQYTSGTTGRPRGVVLTQRNVLHNLSLITANGSRPEEDLDTLPPVVSWLPVFHDMGLVSGVLQPVYLGFGSVLMSSQSFVAAPVRWLRAISEHRAAVSVAPGFGYEECLRRVPASAAEGLDLSSWRLAVIGDEPVRASTIEEFSRRFAPAGFRRSAFFPSYGMAESTVMVSGGPVEPPPMIRGFDAAALARGQVRVAGRGRLARRLVGLGQVRAGLDVAVVDPATRAPCPPDVVGEILISGPSIGQGYWDTRRAAATPFGVGVPGRDGSTFLRTGSLGFLWEGQLFATCRVGDLIIADGRQHYPYDLESTAGLAHPAIRGNRCCAFATPEGVVLVAELGRSAGVVPAAVVEAVRIAIRIGHGLDLAAVVPAPFGALPYTTSAKLRRAECRARYLRGVLPVVTSGPK
ncbi:MULTISPECIES: fatty acyl-AMP ligase [unclassified Crossiella]|uniref:fatty acyl-AMP ligase n=1 Tax=unclassified Crossiella TaxID=2620835 RepID=UPI001FFEA378|nr:MULTISPECIES: fatty acyl-AMP ligase [unclassified Crossiella]MCK2238254.1 fatty acyl-AMP ligase [Crossiella sp. S99.2]MCK2256294.1 fatty acyl-AMP ligase [Crossiella sp. S99.1]